MTQPNEPKSSRVESLPDDYDFFEGMADPSANPPKAEDLQVEPS